MSYQLNISFRFQASEIEPLNKEEETDMRDNDSGKITMCQTKEEHV